MTLSSAGDVPTYFVGTTPACNIRNIQYTRRGKRGPECAYIFYGQFRHSTQHPQYSPRKTPLKFGSGDPRSLILAPIETAYAISYWSFINSNLGPILPRFRDIAGFLLKAAPNPNFGVVSLGLDCRCWISKKPLCVN